MSIPLRNFGKTSVQISALGLGGHHLGGAKDEKTAIDIVHRALDGGITFYDNSCSISPPLQIRLKSTMWLPKPRTMASTFSTMPGNISMGSAKSGLASLS